MLQSDIRNGKFDASDIFVLAPSMKQGTGSSSTPINILENDLVEAGIPCFAVTSDDEALDPDTIREKVVFSSIHQSKGLERKVVVCFGFDESYFRFFAKKLNPLVCPNTWYVALTRATERLYLVGEKHPNHHIPFLRIEQLKELEGRKDPAVKVVQLRGYESWKDPPQFQQDIRSRTSVTDLTRHLIDSQIEKAFTCLNAVQIATATESVEIPDTVPGINGLVESVADVNGVALPAMYEQMNNCSGSDATIMRELQEPWGSTVAAMDLHTGAQALIREVKELRLTTEEMAAKFLELSAIYQAMYLSGFAGMPTQVGVRPCCVAGWRAPPLLAHQLRC